MAVILGNDLIVEQGGTAIAGAKSCRISVEADTIPVSSSTDGDWTHRVAGRKDWSVSVDYLVTSAPINLHSLVGTTVTVKWYKRGTNTKEGGSAILKRVEITAQRGALAKGAFVFEGAGAIS